MAPLAPDHAFVEYEAEPATHVELHHVDLNRCA